MVQKKTKKFDSAVEFTDWLKVHCPNHIPPRHFQIVLKKFLEGRLVIVKSGVATTEIWVG